VFPLSSCFESIIAFLHLQGAIIPTVGLGTWKSAPGDVKAAVIAAIESGYRHIDCAAGYGNEGEVGEALADVISRGIVKREDLFITSKLWVSFAYPDECTAAFEKSLSALKLDYLDLYLIHWPFFLKKGTGFPPADKKDVSGFTKEAFLDVWRELEKLVDAGKIRHLGASNMSAKKLAEIIPGTRIKPAVNQVESHPFLAQSKLLDFCTRHHIVLTAYSPLGSPDRPSRLVEDADPTPLLDETVIAIASKHHIYPAQVLLRWGVQRGTVVIPKSTNPTRIAANLNIYSFALTEDDMSALAALDSNKRLIKGLPFMRDGQTDWHDNWDEDFDHSVTVA
jgi:alcohol dehydrogenase (NADP+)